MGIIKLEEFKNMVESDHIRLSCHIISYHITSKTNPSPKKGSLQECQSRMKRITVSTHASTATGLFPPRKISIYRCELFYFPGKSNKMSQVHDNFSEPVRRWTPGSGPQLSRFSTNFIQHRLRQQHFRFFHQHM